LQGTIYGVGSAISVILFFLILFFSSFHLISVFKWKFKPSYFRGLECLVFLFIFYGVILIISDGQYTNGLHAQPPTINYLKRYLSSLLPVFSCYYFSRKGLLKRNTLRCWVPVFIVVAIAQFFREQRETIEALTSGREDITNNAGYIVLSLVPCMCVFKKWWTQLIGIVICFVFVLMGMKRGAIIIAAIVILIYTFQQFRSLPRSQLVRYCAGIAIVGAFTLNYLNDTLFQNDYFNHRIEETLEGDSSGRDEIYSNFVNIYLYSFDALQKVFGIGAEGTIKVGTNHAHNDWIEAMIDQGIIGIICYVFYWLMFYKSIKDKKIPRKSRDALLLLFVMTLLKSFFSMSVSGITIYMACTLGLSLYGGLSDSEEERVVRC
jgi:O-antigen ligase